MTQLAGDPERRLVPIYDHDFHTRILCGRIDLGAYEFGIGDYDCDRVVDFDDFVPLTACLTGPGQTPYAMGCEAFEYDADDDIDLSDVSRFEAAYPLPWPRAFTTADPNLTRP